MLRQYATVYLHIYWTGDHSHGNHKISTTSFWKLNSQPSKKSTNDLQKFKVGPNWKAHWKERFSLPGNKHCTKANAIMGATHKKGIASTSLSCRSARNSVWHHLELSVFSLNHYRLQTGRQYLLGSVLRGVGQGVGIDFKGAKMAATGRNTQFFYDIQTEDRNIPLKRTVRITFRMGSSDSLFCHKILGLRISHS